MFVKFFVVLVTLSCVTNTAFSLQIENIGWKIALKVFDDCRKADGIVPCIKRKAVTFIDRISKVDNLTLAEGISVMKTGDFNDTSIVESETQLESSLPRNLDEQNDALDDMIIEKTAKFVSSRSLKFSLPFPQLTYDDISSSIEEGRKKKIKIKKKKGGMMGMMGMGLGMLLPLKMILLKIIAKKALIKAKIALLIVLLVGGQSIIGMLGGLFGGKKGGGGGGGGGDHHVEVHDSYGSPPWDSNSGGPYKRSVNHVHDIVYKGYVQ